MTTADGMRKMIALGIPLEQALEIVEAFESTATDARKERNRRYYQNRKASEKRLNSDGDADEQQRLKASEKRLIKTPPRANINTNLSINTNLFGEDSEVETNSESQSRAKPKKATRLPPDFVCDLDWAIAHGLTIDQARIEAAKFVDYWTAKGGANATKLDWQATWRNWVRTAVERQPARPPGRLEPRGMDAFKAAIDWIEENEKGQGTGTGTRSDFDDAGRAPQLAIGYRH